MKRKHVVFSALSVGVGLGIGLGLSTNHAVQKWVEGYIESDDISEEQIVKELKNQVVDGKDCRVTFDDFPCYLSEETQLLLTSVAYVHLKQKKMTRSSSPFSRAILLSGPAELCQQMFARALAHYFESKLMLLDITDFSLKMQRKYGCSTKEPYFKRFISEVTLERLSGWFGSLSILPSTGETRDSLNSTSRFCFDEKLFVQSLYKVLVSISENSSIILYIKDVKKLYLQSPRVYNLFQELIKKLSGSVLVLGSWVFDSEGGCKEVVEKLTMLFPHNIEIKPPEHEDHIGGWKTKLDETMQIIFLEENKRVIHEALAANYIDCVDLNSNCYSEKPLSNRIEEILISAISYHLMDTKYPEYRNGKLVISGQSLRRTLTLFREDNGKDNMNDVLAIKKAVEFPRDYVFEKHIRETVMDANKIGVTFADIGDLDDIKKTLQEVVCFPLRRPDQIKGGLLKHCDGVLLYGPTGTGKTMLAKAIANETGASLIRVSQSIMTTQWYNQHIRNVRALFTVAAKIAPTIIFVDEADSFLGQNMIFKDEFIFHWDELMTKPGKQILILAATNRPFSLDEAIIRRFEHRIMVGLPSAENRVKILKSLLAKEKHENLDFEELSTMTEGYSGSDLKSLCRTAAYELVRELLQQEERLKTLENEAGVQSSRDASNASEDKENQVITLRPINMEDMRRAKSQIAASVDAEGSIMKALVRWNDIYGDSRNNQLPAYFI